MITVSGLTKRYGDRTVVDDVSFDPGARHGDRLPRAERRRQDDDDADDDRPGRRRPRARRSSTAGCTPSCPTRAPSSARCSTPRRVHPGRTGRTHLRAAGRGDRRSRAPRGRGARPGRARPTRPAVGSAATPWACGSGSGSPAHCWPTRRCWCSTSRPTGWTRRASAGCATCCGRTRRAAAPCCCRSHLLSEVEHTVDRLLVIGAGRIVADGPVATLLARRRDGGACGRRRSRWPRTWRRPGSTCNTADGALVVAGADPSQVGAVAAAGGHVLTELRPAERGLEDLFFQLTTAA